MIINCSYRIYNCSFLIYIYNDNFELKIDIKLNKITSFIFIYHLKLNSLKLNHDIYV